jgi:hypothetical protein
MVVPNNCTILTIRNRHRQPAPDLHASVAPNAYVAYFENADGNQWIFVRPPASDRGQLYSSTTDWAPLEVAGTDQLAADLDDHERAWLQTAWATSEARGR